ncbi:MAG: cytidine deaminase [Eubacteriales bacterium]
MKTIDETNKELIEKAREAYNNAYAPYSGYKVGAAVRWLSGKITFGCNVENASFSLSVCAERNAVFRGIAEGEREIESIAIAVPVEQMPSPCGSCRQVLREFAKDCTVILVNGQGKTVLSSLDELLPHSFGPEFINVQNI